MSLGLLRAKICPNLSGRRVEKDYRSPDPISIAYGAAHKPTIAYTQHLGGIWYAGAIDEVAIFEEALSDADVRRLHTLALAVEPTGEIGGNLGYTQDSELMLAMSENAGDEKSGSKHGCNPNQIRYF